MPYHGANWIANESVSACEGGVFDLEMRLPDNDGRRGAAVLEAWPRSNEVDLDVALAAARAAELGWVRLGISGRRELLSAFVADLVHDTAGQAAIARALGLWAHESAIDVVNLAREMDRALRAPGPHAWRGLVASRDGPALFAFTLHEPVVSLARELVLAWLAGRTAIVLADGRLPHVGDLIARAGRQLPSGVLAVLHDDGRTCWRAALLDARVATLHARGPADELAQWRVRGDEMGEGRARGDDMSGSLCARLDIVPSTNRTRVIDDEHDLVRSVHDALDRALSRTRAWSGLSAGHVARLVIPARVFSRATELVIACLEAPEVAVGDAFEPLAIALANARPTLERALRLAHDEGATVIPLGSHTSIAPLLVTNVESGMRCARVMRPAPFLALLRAEDARVAATLAARLDAADPWEE